MTEQDELNKLRLAALDRVGAAKSSAELDAIETEYLGRKGELTQQLRQIGSLPPEARKDFGQDVNDLKVEIGVAIEAMRGALGSAEVSSKLAAEAVDVTLPGRFYEIGRPHILVETLTRIKNIFIGLGYDVFESPEVEQYKYNFEALNYPEEHPAIDEQMSFYITDETLLRTHTTAFQHRVMVGRKPPMRVCTLGKCYRVDAVDATHGHTFHQVDCFTVDHGITMADLKGTLHQFAVEMFGKEVDVRFRPDFFPFVEPGAEVAVTCTICSGKGCNVCKGSGWLELAGAGMIHPNVLESAGIDSEEYTGFAFGFGVERMPMLQYGIGDLRLFMDNDLRFLRQL
ncbi:MAG: phenylalanine--tRNA ligase subunit alpha [Armatimonadetes bacterium]|nr:phenylalanine--tRNA ligase subunit alpha [Armatimonadota bacterium]